MTQKETYFDIRKQYENYLQLTTKLLLKHKDVDPLLYPFIPEVKAHNEEFFLFLKENPQFKKKQL